jgi:hypothetical protein
MTDEWQDTPEDDSITLGPEEALEREIAKSKSLKVERLQLKDQVEQLTAQNRSLRDQLETLKQKRESSPGGLEQTLAESDNDYSGAPQHANRFLPNRWAYFLLVFNLTAIGLLLIYLLQRPAP